MLGKDAMHGEIIHASAVAIGGRAVLLTGASGSGKSELAWALCREGASLIADDAVLFDPAPPFATAASPGSAMQSSLGEPALWIPGIGAIVPPRATLSAHPVALIIRCTPGHRPSRDVADIDVTAIAARHLPTLTLDPFWASAPARIALALARWGL